MYKRKLSQGNSCEMNPFVEHKVLYHRPSFYLRGGIDLSRKERAPLKSVPAQSEDVAEGVVNVLADPRVSALDIAVEASKISVRSREAKKRSNSAQDLKEQIL